MRSCVILPRCLSDDETRAGVFFVATWAGFVDTGPDTDPDTDTDTDTDGSKLGSRE